MKKFMAILMAAVFMAALAACGSGGENQTADKSTKDTSVKSDTSGESTGEKGTGDIKLAFLGAGSNTFGVTLKAAADEKAAELGLRWTTFWQIWICLPRFHRSRHVLRRDMTRLFCSRQMRRELSIP